MDNLPETRTRRLQEHFRGPRGGALFRAVLGLAFLLPVWWGSVQWYQVRLLRELRAQVEVETSLRANAMSAAINRRFALLQGLVAFAQADAKSEDFPTRFETFASGIYQSVQGIRSIALAPGDTIHLVYPQEGNEALMGYQPSRDPRIQVQADVLRAIETRRIILSGPLELIVGGLGLIARQAVYLDNDYWGLANIALELGPILDRAGLNDPTNEFDFAVRDGAGSIYHGSSEVFENSPVIHAIPLAEGAWELAGVPKGGWLATIRGEVTFFQAVALGVVGLLVALIYVTSNRQTRLALAVQERTREIAAINARLEEDIDKRRRVEAELRASEELYRTLAHHFPNGAVILFDTDLRYTLADGAGLSEVGLSRDMLEGRTLSELFPADTTALLEPHYRAALAGKPATIEVPFANRLYEVHTLPLQNDRGEIFAGMAMTQDITERKRAEEALRASEARQRALLNAIPDLIYRVNRQGVFLDAYGVQAGDQVLPEREVTGIGGRDLPLSPQVYQEILAAIETVIETDKMQILEYEIATPEGLRSYETRVVRSGEEEVVTIVRDITERKLTMAALEEREEQYRQVFELVKDGLFINTLEGRLVAFNQAAHQMHGYTADEFRQLHPNQFIHPDDHVLFADFIKAIREGQGYQCRATDLKKDGTPIQVEVFGVPFSHRGQPHALAIVRDISEQVQAFQLLEHRVQERTRELSTLLDLSHTVASTLELRPLLELIIDQLRQVVDYTGASILVLEGEELVVGAYLGPIPRDQALQTHYPLAAASVNRQVVQRKEPLIIADVLEDHPTANAFRKTAGEALKSSYSYIRSWMGVPLVVKDRVIGMFTLDHQQTNYYQAYHANLALAFANQAAVAMENARLFTAEQRRAEQFRVIGEVGRQITSILTVDELLVQTARLIRETFGYYHVHIGLVEGDEVVYKTQRALDDPQFQRCEAIRPKVGKEGFVGWVAQTGEPVLVADALGDSRYIGPPGDPTRSELVLPITVKGQVIGVIDAESDRLNAFDESDLAVMQSLANQTAVAIENARLYEQAQELASLRERQKLARELHDSVSQALYGIALGSRTAQALLSRASQGDPLQASLMEPLDYVVSLAEAGLAEMRALIFELRPESLEAEGLVVALQKQAASLRARHQLQVNTEFCDEPALSLENKQALYRIAQEALHNTIKHAHAGQASLALIREAASLKLEVADDGSGFDPEQDFPGHLGLRSMRERAERLGASFSILSSPGAGTVIRVQLPLPE